MAELIAKTACADLLPLELVGLTLTEVVEDHVTVIAPYKDQHKAVSDLLQKSHGFGLPAVNRSSGKEGGRAIQRQQPRATYSLEPNSTMPPPTLTCKHCHMHTYIQIHIYSYVHIYIYA